MRLLPIVLFLLLAGCRVQTGVQTSDLCARPCFVGDAKLAGVGACNYGHYGCDSENDGVCIGSGSPSQEVCDGIDNDCNGQIDELANCCKNPAPEICDGKDNNCDGQVDEPDAFEEVFCYTGPKGTAGIGICKPGVLRCTGEAGFKCMGEVLPESEICDGIDNDCDGQIDEDLKTQAAVDLVFVLDDSGSMGTKIDALVQSVNTFAVKYKDDQNIRWALVTAPDADVATWRSLPHLFMDFTTADNFAAGMSVQDATGSGAEPTLDALAQICSPYNPLGLSWAVGARKVVIVLSDEEPQTYATPKNPASDVATACLAMGIPLNLFVVLNPLDPGWKTLAQKTLGRLYEINSPLLSQNLETLLPGLICR